MTPALGWAAMRAILIVRDKVTRQCPQSTTFEEKGKPKQIRTEVPLLSSLTPYRRAKPAQESEFSSYVKVEVDALLPVPSSQVYGLCGRKATLN